jgi:hypothetical protein
MAHAPSIRRNEKQNSKKQNKTKKRQKYKFEAKRKLID